MPPTEAGMAAATAAAAIVAAEDMVVGMEAGDE
jgi:hypothetical protein